MSLTPTVTNPFLTVGFQWPTSKIIQFDIQTDNRVTGERRRQTRQDAEKWVNQHNESIWSLEVQLKDKW